MNKWEDRFIRTYLKAQELKTKLNKIAKIMKAKTDISVGGNSGWITINRNNKILKEIREVLE